ncbi:MAG: ANTAR domain-containing protein [Desulfobacterales bacterium]
MVKTKVIQEELESRKLIEKAKEILMLNRSLTGDEAYRWIQKRSMDSRKTMRQVSRGCYSFPTKYFRNTNHRPGKSGDTHEDRRKRKSPCGAETHASGVEKRQPAF